MSKDKKSAIIEAARQRFSAHGYSKVTMEEIASDLSITKAALYYHFADKDELFSAVAEIEQKKFFERAEELVLQEKSSIERLKTYFNLRIDLTKGFLNLGWTGGTLPTEIRPSLHSFYEAFFKHEEEIVLRLINSGIKRGELAPENSEKIAALIVHLFHGMRMRRRYFNVPMEEFTREIALLADVILNGIAIH